LVESEKSILSQLYGCHYMCSFSYFYLSPIISISSTQNLVLNVKVKEIEGQQQQTMIHEALANPSFQFQLPVAPSIRVSNLI
jgi:hypothetical protein